MVLGAAGAALREVGVAAVVKNASKYKKDMLGMSLANLGFGRSSEAAGKKTSIFSRILSGLGDILKNALGVASGILIAGALRKIGELLVTVAGAAFEAAVNFQNLEIRLQGLLANQLINENATLNFAQALEIAKGQTGALFIELQKLSFLTPFTSQSVIDVFTLASSYGFARDRAKELTEATTEFAAGMGLSEQVMVRIIENLGQMQQQGKITGTELRDLGRGAFVPINDLLEMTAANLGITVDELNDLRHKGLAPVEPLLDAFIQMVGERFPGAGRRASRTFAGLISNVKDFGINVVGLLGIKPALDAIAGSFANIFSALIEDPRLIPVMETIGFNLKRITQNLLEFLPEGQSLVDFLIEKLGVLSRVLGLLAIGRPRDAAALLGIDLSKVDAFFAKINEIKTKLQIFYDKVKTIVDDLKALFQELKTVFTGGAPDLEGPAGGATIILGEDPPIVVFAKKIMETLDLFKQFWAENGEEIKTIVGEVLEALFGEGEDLGEGLLEIAGNALVLFGTWLVANGPAMTENLRKIADVLIELIEFVGEHSTELFVLYVVFKLLSPIVFALAIGFGLLALGAIALGTPLAIIALAAGLTILPFVGLLILVGLLVGAFFLFREEIKTFVQETKKKIEEWKTKFTETIEEVKKKWEDIDWEAIGSDLAGAIGAGILLGLLGVIAAAETLARAAVAAFNRIWDTGSPPKVFIDLGQDVGKAVASGIEKTKGLVAKAAENMGSLAITGMASRAMAGQAGSVTSNTTNNLSMTVNTQSRSEPVIADFEVMRSMVT